MHELGVVFTVLDKIEEVGKENDLKEVKTVVLEIGEVSAIIDEYLLDCWKWAAAKRELTKAAELKIEQIPAVTYCEDCKQTYKTVEFGKICPHCQSEQTYLLQGNEFKIKEIEAY